MKKFIYGFVCGLLVMFMILFYTKYTAVLVLNYQVGHYMNRVNELEKRVDELILVKVQYAGAGLDTINADSAEIDSLKWTRLNFK